MRRTTHRSHKTREAITGYSQSAVRRTTSRASWTCSPSSTIFLTRARHCEESPFGAASATKLRLPKPGDRCLASFRKARRLCLHSQRLRNQSPLESPRTCFEGPFGELLRATGPIVRANPFRFSTKYQDDETDLLCYGYRYYNPSTGRWLSKDPLEEMGGLNLYCMTKNNAV
jgi:RHS repeat-associated protein